MPLCYSDLESLRGVNMGRRLNFMSTGLAVFMKEVCIRLRFHNGRVHEWNH